MNLMVRLPYPSIKRRGKGNIKSKFKVSFKCKTIVIERSSFEKHQVDLGSSNLYGWRHKDYEECRAWEDKAIKYRVDDE